VRACDTSVFGVWRAPPGCGTLVTPLPTRRGTSSCATMRSTASTAAAWTAGESGRGTTTRASTSETATAGNQLSRFGRLESRDARAGGGAPHSAASRCSAIDHAADGNANHCIPRYAAPRIARWQLMLRRRTFPALEDTIRGLVGMHVITIDLIAASRAGRGRGECLTAAVGRARDEGISASSSDDASKRDELLHTITASDRVVAALQAARSSRQCPYSSTAGRESRQRAPWRVPVWIFFTLSTAQCA